MQSNLSHYRKQAGLSQVQLSERCGWGRAQGRIGHYENNKRQPSINDIRTIIQVLNSVGVKCSFDDIYPPTSAKDRVA